MQFLQRSTSQWLRTILVLSLSLGFVQETGGQRIGIDVCSCAPSTYEFKFDFSLFCPPINITQGDAVVDTSCLVSPFQDQSVSDLVPIAVQEITVLELDQNLDNLFQEIIRGSFNDGDTFSYTSVAAQSGKTDPNSIPRGIQFNIVGINILEQPIINQVIIIFSNNCQAYPVLIPGQYAGWVRFLDLEEPLGEYCLPFATDEPSAAPSLFTPGPTFYPTTLAPTPTSPTTSAPTASTLVTPAPTPSSPATPPPTPPPQMSMSMSMPGDLHFDIFDLLEDEFGLPRSDCSEKSGSESVSSTRYTKKSTAGKSGKGGGDLKGNKKMGKGGVGKGGRSGDSSSMMTDASLKSNSSSKGKSGKGGKGGRLLRVRDCDDTGGKATNKIGKSGKGGSILAKSGKGGSGSSKGVDKLSKKASKGDGKGGGAKGSNKHGKGGDSGFESFKGEGKLSKKGSNESRRFIL